MVVVCVESDILWKDYGETVGYFVVCIDKSRDGRWKGGCCWR